MPPTDPTAINKKKIFSIASILVVVVGIFVTVGLSRNVQRFFSRAFDPPGSYGYGAYDAGAYTLGVQATPTPTPNVTPTPTPTALATSSPTPTPSSTAAPSASPTKPGDANGDGKVDIFDFNLVIRDLGKTGPGLKGDLNKDNLVNILDFNLVVRNLGK